MIDILFSFLSCLVAVAYFVTTEGRWHFMLRYFVFIIIFLMCSVSAFVYNTVVDIRLAEFQFLFSKSLRKKKQKITVNSP